MNEKILRQPNLYRYIDAYRQYGYKKSLIDPLNQNNPRISTAQLDPLRYGLDHSTQYEVNDLLFLLSNANGSSHWSVQQIESYLQDVYSKSCSIEFDYLRNEEEKYWIAREFEHMQQTTLDNQTRTGILKLMLKSEVNENKTNKRACVCARCLLIILFKEKNDFFRQIAV